VATLTVRGVERLRSSATRAADQASDIAGEWGDDAGTIVLAAVHPPIRTGTLAATVHVVKTEQGFGIAAGGARAPYVAIVNARHPFLTDAFHDRESAVVDQAADAVERLLGTIQGA
jgi:hypothetical protein